MTEKFTPWSGAEKGPEGIAREEVVKILREKGGGSTEAREAYSQWLALQEERRDKGEITEGRVTIDSIQLMLDADLIEMAVGMCRDIVGENRYLEFDPNAPKEQMISDDGDDIHAFCMSVLQEYGGS